MTIKDVRAIVETIPGLHFKAWGPGDGVTRYRIFNNDETDYHSSHDAIFTGLGPRETVTFLTGYRAAMKGQFSHA